jgi:hypothetical protein
MTEEATEIRGLKEGEDAYSPAHHADMVTAKQIRDKVNWLKRLIEGVPVDAKIGCGNIEKDLDLLVGAGVDFIAIDGFGGGTGTTSYYVRENVGIPLMAALPRVVRYLQRRGVREQVTLIADGNLRTSADYVKCIALGADAVYSGTAALIAINCEQYQVCHTGLCPTGITTQDPVLARQSPVEEGGAEAGQLHPCNDRRDGRNYPHCGKNRCPWPESERSGCPDPRSLRGHRMRMGRVRESRIICATINMHIFRGKREELPVQKNRLSFPNLSDGMAGISILPRGILSKHA